MQQLCLQLMISSSLKQISFALIANFCKKKRLRWKMKVTNNRLADGGEVIQLILNFNSISFVWCRSGFLRLYHETNRVDNYLTALQFPHVLLQWQNCSLFALHYVTGHCHKIISVPYQVRLSPISPISSICKLNIMIITFFISNLEWLQFLKITLMFSTFRLLNDNRLTHIPNRAFKSLQKLKVL